MASISPANFIEPRVRAQTTFAKIIDFKDKSAGQDPREWSLEIENNGRLLGLKYFNDDNGAAIHYVRLPHKMTAALYHAARRKGYAT